jgi:hypothetical protein
MPAKLPSIVLPSCKLAAIVAFIDMSRITPAMEIPRLCRVNAVREKNVAGFNVIT